MTLEKLRARIDALDSKLVKLLNDRAGIALEIGRIKRGKGIATHIPSREKAILARVNRLSRGPMSKASLRSVYREIMAACRECQKEQKH